MSKRTQIYLSEDQWERVERKADLLGISCAEVIRRAIDADVEAGPRFSDVVRKVAGAWSHLADIDDAFVETMRREGDERILDWVSHRYGSPDRRPQGNRADG